MRRMTWIRLQLMRLLRRDVKIIPRKCTVCMDKLSRLTKRPAASYFKDEGIFNFGIMTSIQ
eukprot:scaffold28372_cov111-Skeletonema_dohrnii-CCMP3373.AAC.1